MSKRMIVQCFVTVSPRMRCRDSLHLFGIEPAARHSRRQSQLTT